MSESGSILIVDDERRMRDSLATLLTEFGHRASTCSSGYEAIELLGSHKFDIVLLDIYMEGMDGFELMEKMAGHQNGIDFIVMTGFDFKETPVKAFTKGACHFLKKPFEPDELLAIIENTLAKKKKTDLLRLREKRFSHLAENARDMIYRMSLPDGRYEYVNSASLEILGYSPEDFYKEPMIIRKIIHPEWVDYFEKQWVALLAGEMPEFYEYQIIHKRGETRWIRQRNKLIRGSDGRPIAIEGIVSDITEQKKYEKKILESEAKFRSLFDLSPLPIAVSEMATGKLIDVNKELCDFSKYAKEELVGKSAIEVGFYSAEDREKFVPELKASGEVKGLEMDFRLKDGSLRNTLMFARTIQTESGEHILTATYDQTDRKHLEAQNWLIQRLEAIGTLSGGIAHEFNNALQNVIGNIELLQLELAENEKVDKFFRKTHTSTRRMADLVNQLLAYARGGKYRSEIVNLSDFIRSTLPLVSPEIGTDIKIVTNLSEDIYNIYADTSQLQMVLSAVLTNAIEALEGKGRIYITTGKEEIDEAWAAGYPGLKQGPYVSLKIKDNGKGVDEEIKSRMFDPFFTTKAKGRGLGMAATYGIIKNHGGYLYVDSEPGKGTTVCMLIPPIQPV